MRRRWIAYRAATGSSTHRSRLPSAIKGEHILSVNLVGTARLLDVLQARVGFGCVGIVIASMGAEFVHVPADAERQLALGPVNELAAVCRQLWEFDNPDQAYLRAKRGNQLRVEAEALRWAERGARLLSISLGLTSTAQGRLELKTHPQVIKVLEGTPLQGIGTPEDIAAAVEWRRHPLRVF